MGFKFLKINLLIIGIFFVCPGILLAGTKSINVNVGVYICDNNTLCDPDQGEDYINCPLDCPAPICNNNGTCESGLGEDENSCPSDCPHVVPTTTPTTTGSIFLPIDKDPPIISDISVFSISRTNANVSWTTNELAYCQLDWGDSSEYSSGSIVEISFFTDHSTEIPGLSPGMNYYFQIFCYDRSHNLGRVENEWFTTLPFPPISPSSTATGTSGHYPISPIGRPTGTIATPSTGTMPVTSGTGATMTPGQASSTGLGILYNVSVEVINLTNIFSVWVIGWIYSAWWWIILAIIIFMAALFWWFVIWKRRRRIDSKEDKDSGSDQN